MQNYYEKIRELLIFYVSDLRIFLRIQLPHPIEFFIKLSYHLDRGDDMEKQSINTTEAKYKLLAYRDLKNKNDKILKELSLQYIEKEKRKYSLEIVHQEKIEKGLMLEQFEDVPKDEKNAYYFDKYIQELEDEATKLSHQIADYVAFSKRLDLEIAELKSHLRDEEEQVPYPLDKLLNFIGR